MSKSKFDIFCVIYICLYVTKNEITLNVGLPCTANFPEVPVTVQDHNVYERFIVNRVVPCERPPLIGKHNRSTGSKRLRICSCLLLRKAVLKYREWQNIFSLDWALENECVCCCSVYDPYFLLHLKEKRNFTIYFRYLLLALLPNLLSVHRPFRWPQLDLLHLLHLQALTHYLIPAGLEPVQNGPHR